jgi:hypothetical protein
MEEANIDYTENEITTTTISTISSRTKKPDPYLENVCGNQSNKNKSVMEC